LIDSFAHYYQSDENAKKKGVKFLIALPRQPCKETFALK